MFLAPVVNSSNKESKSEDAKVEAPAPKLTEAQDKKNAKRSSIFGMSLFGGKKDATSPGAEKSQNEGAASSRSGDAPSASEEAPKIDQPVQTKPIDAEAVTAPANASATAPAASDPASAEQGATTPTKGASTPSAHKSNIMGFFKRQDSKLDVRLET